MTEYQYEQRQEERRLEVEAGIVSAALAACDRREGFEVKCVVESWDNWNKIEASLLSEGWELAPYGQRASLFIRSGVFRRRSQAGEGDTVCKNDSGRDAEGQTRADDQKGRGSNLLGPSKGGGIEGGVW